MKKHDKAYDNFMDEQISDNFESNSGEKLLDTPQLMRERLQKGREHKLESLKFTFYQRLIKWFKK